MIGQIWLSPPMIAGLASELGVHRTTVARWIRRGRMPPAVERYLELKHNGRLCTLHEAWNGWRITRTGQLATPTGDVLTPGQILSMPYQYRLACELRHRVTTLEQNALTRAKSNECQIHRLQRRCKNTHSQLDRLDDND